MTGGREASAAYRFAVRLTPKGGRDAIDGWRADAGGKPVLAARVSAKTLDVAKSQVRIVTGETSRMKIVEVAGDSRSLAARLTGAGSRL